MIDHTRSLGRLGQVGAVLIRVVWFVAAFMVLVWCWKKRAIIYYGVTASVYSATLASSLAFVGLGLLAALLIRYRSDTMGSRWSLILAVASRSCAIGALILVASSASTHAYFDHGSGGTYGSMSPLLFVKEHPAFVVVAALSALVLWWSRPTSSAS